MKIFELRGRVASAVRTTAALALIMASFAALPGESQAQKKRWTDLVYRPATTTGTPADTSSLKLAAVVDLFSSPPRWRAELRIVADRPGSSDQAIVLVADAGNVRVITALGSTPLTEHAAGRDPLVQAVAARFDARGSPAGRASGRMVETGPSGAVRWVVVRRPTARADFSDDLLTVGSASLLGRNIARFGVHTIGGEQRSDVIASAGARGVRTVRTVNGDITVEPDPAAINALDALDIGLADLERFWQEGDLLGAGRAGDKPPPTSDTKEAAPGGNS